MPASLRSINVSPVTVASTAPSPPRVSPAADPFGPAGTRAARPAVNVLDHIRATGLSHSYGDRRVLTDLSLTVSAHERMGLIGENGVGKSTLLRILAGVEESDSGVVARPARSGLLWQEVQFDPSDTLQSLIEAALSEIRAIESELTDAASALAEPDSASARAARYEAALEAAERAEVWSADARRDEILAGLGVGDIPLSRRLDEVSGGQRSRFALAALLLGRPDALLLDEPTNHLDDSAAEFLQRQLAAWHGPVIFASHDRTFLDAVANTLLDIDPARQSSGSSSGGKGSDGSSGTRFSGNYSHYLAHKAAERGRWETQYAEEQQELKRMRFAVDGTARQVAPNRGRRDNDKMGYDFKGGNVSRQISRRIRNAEGRLETLERNQVRKPRAPLTFAGIPSGSHALTSDGLLLQATDAVVAGRLNPPPCASSRNRSC